MYYFGGFGLKHLFILIIIFSFSFSQKLAFELQGKMNFHLKDTEDQSDPNPFSQSELEPALADFFDDGAGFAFGAKYYFLTSEEDEGDSHFILGLNYNTQTIDGNSDNGGNIGAELNISGFYPHIGLGGQYGDTYLYGTIGPNIRTLEGKTDNLVLQESPKVLADAVFNYKSSTSFKFVLGADFGGDESPVNFGIGLEMEFGSTKLESADFTEKSSGSSINVPAEGFPDFLANQIAIFAKLSYQIDLSSN